MTIQPTSSSLFLPKLNQEQEPAHSDFLAIQRWARAQSNIQLLGTSAFAGSSPTELPSSIPANVQMQDIVLNAAFPQPQGSDGLYISSLLVVTFADYNIKFSYGYSVLSVVVPGDGPGPNPNLFGGSVVSNLEGYIAPPDGITISLLYTPSPPANYESPIPIWATIHLLGA